MTYIFTSLVIFLQILWYIIILDVILSWIELFGILRKPQAIKNIIDPIYSFIRRYIPTSLGPIDFTPIIVLFAITFMMGVIFNISPEAYSQLSRFR